METVTIMPNVIGAIGKINKSVLLDICSTVRMVLGEDKMCFATHSEASFK